ncbi:hypothetical protein V6N13_053835 [Hibiscus sabdariffa]|uniref:Uncharacterized protein n=1 Tax=Hibiscus sabdariffa TaxID=183260 RepID=A0ABR2T6F6_9ROSI
MDNGFSGNGGNSILALGTSFFHGRDKAFIPSLHVLKILPDRFLEKVKVTLSFCSFVVASLVRPLSLWIFLGLNPLMVATKASSMSSKMGCLVAKSGNQAREYKLAIILSHTRQDFPHQASRRDCGAVGCEHEIGGHKFVPNLSFKI